MPKEPGKRILVVDDQADVCESIRMLLSYDGHLIETASGADQALAKFDGAKFDVVFTDFSMPGMKGDELALQIKKRSPATPVILLTAFPPALRPTAIDLVITKPFLLQNLRDGIAQVCQN
jgi:CheY-like chemotaxis protein